MELSGQWCMHRRDKTETAHFLIGPYGTQEPLGYGTLCGSLSGARGWQQSDRADRRCGRCTRRLGTPTEASTTSTDDQPTERAAREFWNNLEPSERNALVSGTAQQDRVLMQKLAAAGMVLTTVELRDDADVAQASESSPNSGEPERPLLCLARELIMIIDRGDPEQLDSTN